jgi:Domain of unknown function (DUF3850)
METQERRLPTMHVLKCWAEPFAALLSGAKRHEIRKNDRGFREGDVLDLMEWDPEHDAFMGRMIRMRVTHISAGWGLPDGLVVMSVAKMVEPGDNLLSTWAQVNQDTAYAAPFGTIRVCHGCGALVAGGPTACGRCARHPIKIEVEGRSPDAIVERLQFAGLVQELSLEVELSSRCEECAPEFGCFSGAAPCRKRPQ